MRRRERHPREMMKSETSESEHSDVGNGDDEKEDASAQAQRHSKGDQKMAKIMKRLIFGTLLLLVLCGIIAAGHLWTLLFVRTGTGIEPPLILW